MTRPRNIATYIARKFSAIRYVNQASCVSYCITRKKFSDFQKYISNLDQDGSLKRFSEMSVSSEFSKNLNSH